MAYTKYLINKTHIKIYFGKNKWNEAKVIKLVYKRKNSMRATIILQYG